MKKLHALCATAALLGGLFTIGQAQAADTPGAYLLVGGGTSHLDGDCSGTTKCDNNGNAFKFVGGYRLGNGIAIEGVVFDFGKATATSQGIDVEIKNKAYGGGVAVYAELAPNWVVKARLGIASVKVTGTGRLGTISVSESETSTNAYVGLGLAYHFTDTVSAELGYDATKAKFSGETGNISAITIGVGVKF